MLKLILTAYINTISLLKKKPLVILLLAFIALAHIPIKFAMARFEQDSLNYNLLFNFSLLISITLTVYLYWVVFNSENITSLSLGEWIRKYYLRFLIQYVGGFLLYFPFYTALRLMFGEDGLAVKPGHDILMISMSVWVFIAMDLAVLWLCFRNEGFFRNAKNSINDAFRNIGYYLILRLLMVTFAYLSQMAQSGFATFTGLACGFLILTSVLECVSWIALAFGFLGLRKREQMNSTSGGVQVEENYVS